jgi:hypothetical protein
LEDQPRRQLLVKITMFTNVFAKVMVAVPHRSGVCPFQINFVTTAFLDWIFMLINGHMVSLFDARVLESLPRMRVSDLVSLPRCLDDFHDQARGVQEGYESRAVAGTIFQQTLMALMANEDLILQANDRNWYMQPAVDATLACRLNPLAMTEVRPNVITANQPILSNTPVPQAVSVAHCLLTRGVHSGMISIVSCLIQAFRVPIIPIHHLWAFFEKEQVCDPFPRARI